MRKYHPRGCNIALYPLTLQGLISDTFQSISLQDNMHNNTVHVVYVKICEILKRYMHYTTYRSASQSVQSISRWK